MLAHAGWTALSGWPSFFDRPCTFSEEKPLIQFDLTEQWTFLKITCQRSLSKQAKSKGSVSWLSWPDLQTPPPHLLYPWDQWYYSRPTWFRLKNQPHHRVHKVEHIYLCLWASFVYLLIVYAYAVGRPMAESLKYGSKAIGRGEWFNSWNFIGQLSAKFHPCLSFDVNTNFFFLVPIFFF